MRRKLKRFFRWSLLIGMALVLVHLVVMLIFRFVPIPGTPLMVIRGTEKLARSESPVYRYSWVSWKEISPHIKVAVMCAEDQRFPEHYGFDLKAIEKAIDYNERQAEKGKTKRRGASTISQQTAKNVCLWPGRSMLRKGLEVYFTALIELCWSKERILEVYLNVAEMGDGIYGVEAAARKYFNKSAAKLTKAESALLASILPSPRKYSVTKPGPYMQRRQRWVMRQMGYNTGLYEFAEGKQKRSSR